MYDTQWVKNPIREARKAKEHILYQKQDTLWYYLGSSKSYHSPYILLA